MSETPKEESFTKNDYGAILELFYQVSELLVGSKFEGDDHLNGLVLKLFGHATSILKLTEGIKHIPGMTVELDFIDTASMTVLARSSLETYSMIHHIFQDPKDDDEFKFRLYYSQYRGLATRKSSVPQTHQAAQQLKKDLQEMQHLIKIVRTTNKYQNLKTPQKNQVENGKFDEISKKAIIVRSGFSQANTDLWYGYLSDYTHSGFLSSLQINQADKKQQETNIEAELVQAAVPLVLTIHLLIEKYPQAQPALDNYKKNNGSWYDALYLGRNVFGI